ncbi:MAG: hypothetical protein ACYCQJ_06335 [Nitrososphaerales archaeon]
MDLKERFTKASKKAGWKEIPRCPYILLGDDGELHCTYALETLEKDLHSALLYGGELNPSKLHAIDSNRSETKDICSVAQCPRLSTQKRNIGNKT